LVAASRFHADFRRRGGDLAHANADENADKASQAGNPDPDPEWNLLHRLRHFGC
jgi:hypothetical protein